MNGTRHATQGGTAMTKERNAKKPNAKDLGRREFLKTLGAGTAAAAASAPMVAGPAAADTESNDEKSKARYQPNSPLVQKFYSVNRYPAQK
jgi:hypothetical protein